MQQRMHKRRHTESSVDRCGVNLSGQFEAVPSGCAVSWLLTYQPDVSPLTHVGELQTGSVISAADPALS